MIELTVDSKELREALRRVGARAQDGRIPLSQFYAEWKAVVIVAANAIKASGGQFRGRSWPGMKSQYTRKTDGVTVPAWGGVPRVREGFKKRSTGPGRGRSTGVRMARVSGLVSGKLRPSGQRVRQTSVMNRDTGALMNRLLASRPLILQRRTLIIGGDLPEYAEPVLRGNGRNPIFFASDDQARLSRCVERWIDGLAGRFNR